MNIQPVKSLNIKKGDRVTFKGKEYEVEREPWIDTSERNNVDYRGQLVTYVQPINSKTGKAWQACQLHRLADLQPKYLM